MKINLKTPSPVGTGFTLTETMIAMSIVMLVMAGVLATHLCGLRMFELTKAKITADHDARKAVSQLTDEIRGAKWVQVGNYADSEFTVMEDGEPQRGNALQIYNSSSNSPFIRYYLDADSTELRRVTNDTMAPVVIARAVTNSLVFTSEDINGTPLTTNENNRVIGLNLQFYQIQYPIIKIGPGEFYDYYQLNTRITRRTLE
jgi:Tfp pilus assembly protein PilW